MGGKSQVVLAAMLGLATAGCGFKKITSTSACFAYIVTSDTHTCARKTDSTLWCWGGNQYGQLGIGNDPSPRPEPTFVDTLGSTAARIYLPTAIGMSSTRTAFTCSRRSDSTLWCWGQNQDGQLGTGDMDARTRPTRIAPETFAGDVHSVAAGAGFACARRNDGTVWCWGQNEQGQLGLNDTARRLEPAQVAPEIFAGDATQVAAGGAHACALKADSTLWCWGHNQFGQLGTADTRPHRIPTRVSGFGNDVAIVFAGADHTCAVKTDASLWCWGQNQYGQLGLGDTRSRSAPARVDFTDLGTGVTVVSGGAPHACAVKTDGSLWCWGGNQFGQLGRGDRQQSADPVQVRLPSGVTIAQVYAGGTHTCARSVQNALYCWGANEYGQLGARPDASGAVLEPRLAASACP